MPDSSFQRFYKVNSRNNDFTDVKDGERFSFGSLKALLKANEKECKSFCFLCWLNLMVEESKNGGEGELNKG